MHEHLPALAAKVATALANTSAHFVTQPVELRILQGMSEAAIRVFGSTHGWRVVRRLGGRRIELYNDAAERLLSSLRSQTSEDRKNHARRDDVDLECNRDHRGNYRLDKKVIAWEEFVSGRGGGLRWFYSARSSRQLFTAGFRWSDCNTLPRRK